MPIEGSAGTLDIENATLRSNAIAVLTNLVTGNDGVRESGAPALEVYGDPGPRLELVSNTAATDGTATFTRLESNVGVFSIQSGTDAATNGPITFGGFANERMRIDADGNVGIGTTDPQYKLDVGNGGGDVMLRVMHQNASSGKLIFGRSGNTEIRSHAIESYNSSGSQNNYMKFLVHDGTGTSPYETRTEVMTLLGNGNVGIGTDNPSDLTHIRTSGGNGVDGLLIEQNNTGTGSAALRFGVAGTNETTNVGIPKAGIFFKRSATNGRGDLLFCIDNVDDTSSVGTSDAALKITSEGYVQPGDINTSFLGTSGTGANGSLKGNYLFQGIYNVYRVNGYANASWNGVYEKYVQVVRMGSLLTIQGYIPLLLTSTTMDLQFTWAELGLDGRRALTTLINQSTSTTGTWGSATANSTYLTLPSTGHAGNGTVDYNNIKYLIDLSHISNY